MRRQILTVLLCWLVANVAYGQQYKWQAPLEKVPENSYYDMLLDTSVSTHLHPGFNDLRLYDEAGKEVPYIIGRRPSAKTETHFHTYPVLEEIRKPGCCSWYVLHNMEKRSISDLSLVIRNADVRKEVKLLGSDDRKNWFVVKDKHTLTAINSSIGTAELKLLDFPLSNYEYFKLELEDSGSAPISILSAGYSETYSIANSHYLSLPTPVLKQKDSAKQTIIDLNFPSLQYTDKLALIVDGPPNYKRQATLQEKIRSEKGKAYYRDILSFEINSYSPKDISLNTYALDSFRILVENEDNPPLRFVKAMAWQERNYLTAYLESGQNYSLYFGKEEAEAPSYDLPYFRDSLPATRPLVAYGHVSPVTKEIALAKSDSLFDSNNFIWAVLGIIMVLLAFVSHKMIKEMGSKGES